MDVWMIDVNKNYYHNVFTPGINNDDDEFATRIYSDCFPIYRPEDFRNMGFVLHKVNHWVWFGQSMFNTISIEGL